MALGRTFTSNAYGGELSHVQENRTATESDSRPIGMVGHGTMVGPGRYR